MPSLIAFFWAFIANSITFKQWDWSIAVLVLFTTSAINLSKYVRGSLEAKNLSPEKIRKEIQLYIENALVELLTDEQRNKYFSLKESLNVKKVYKLVDGSHEQIDLVTGLNSGGYTEIIKGEIQEGDEVISKVIVETSEKKALRLF